MKSKIKYIYLVISLLSISCNVNRDDPNHGLSSMRWGSAIHSDPFFSQNIRYLAVTELYGPPNARVDSMLPGLYLMRGTFALPDTLSPRGYVISLGFEGMYDTIQNRRNAYRKVCILAADSLRGSFEVEQEVFVFHFQTANRPEVDLNINDVTKALRDRVVLY